MKIAEKLGLQRRLAAMRVGSTRCMHAESYAPLIPVTRVAEGRWKVRDSPQEESLIDTVTALNALWETGEIKTGAVP